MEGLIASEELVGYDSTHMIAKGKRTKRLRLLTPSGGVAPSISSCSSGGGDDHGNSFSISSSTTITDQEEEEDMANCLILLAQGGGGGDGGGRGGDSHHHHHHEDHDDDDDHGDGNKRVEILKGRKISEIGGATNNNSNKVGFYIYECKTCNRTFPSFQALGGHRASHKRPKMMTMVTAEEKKPLSPPASPAPLSPPLPPPAPLMSQSPSDTNYDQHQFELGGGERQQHHQIKIGPSSISLQLGVTHKNSNGNNNNKGNKIHECSICGSEFTSGQALGGHMRRHRASTNTTTPMMTSIEAAAAAMEVQPKNILELDLNLPAPEEDLRPEPPKFQFAAATTQKSMVLSAAPALVDCHY